MAGNSEGNNDLKIVKPLEEDLKYLESMKKYIQKGESLVGSNTLGKDSDINRDYHFTNDKLRIFGVFDGVGNEEGSAFASASASKFIKSTLEKYTFNDISLEQTKELIKRTLIGKNKGLKRQQKHNFKMSEIKTTALVANVMKDGTVVIGNVGDCRALLIKRGAKDVEHLTLDNSLYNDTHLQHGMHTCDDLLQYQKQIAQIEDFSKVGDTILESMIRHRNELGRYLCMENEDAFSVDLYEHKL